MPVKSSEKSKYKEVYSLRDIDEEEYPAREGKKSMPQQSKKDYSTNSLVDQLLETNISLQEKVVDLISSTKELVKRMDNMVKLFEEASSQLKSGTDEPLMRRLEELLEQNKTIAKGLILLEKYVREKASSGTIPPFQKSPPLDRF